MPDEYDRMTRSQLEEVAGKRTPPVDLSSATTNAERAVLLREDDATSPAVEVEPEAAVEEEPEVEVEAEEAEAEEVAEEETAGDEHPAAPYPSDEDLQRRLAVAGGVDGAEAAGG